MPRDSTATKQRLLREAERLFARRGLYQVTVREITEAAEQRNVSALNYHFGSHDGLLDAILTRHGDPTDVARGVMLAAVGHDASSRELVAALVVPYAAKLSRPDGRDYLRIVAQLSARFSSWRDAAPGTGPYLREILGILEERPPHVAPAVRHHWKDFLTAIDNRGTPVADIEQGHISTASCILANLSMKLGRTLTWDAAAQRVVGDEEANRVLARPYR